MKRLLVVVDMQNDFIDGSLGSAEARLIVGNVRRKIAAYVRDGDAVVFTRDTHFDNYLETQEGQRLPVNHCISGTQGWQLADGLNTGGASVWDKKAFGSPELAEYVRGLTDIGEIELVGLCTDICVISNALILKAFVPEMPIKVDAGCCAGVTPESHRNALEAMKMCHIEIINQV